MHLPPPSWPPVTTEAALFQREVRNTVLCPDHQSLLGLIGGHNPSSNPTERRKGCTKRRSKPNPRFQQVMTSHDEWVIINRRLLPRLARRGVMMSTLSFSKQLRVRRSTVASQIRILEGATSHFSDLESPKCAPSRNGSLKALRSREPERGQTRYIWQSAKLTLQR